MTPLTALRARPKLRMTEGSLYAPSGCLFPYHNLAPNETDLDGI